MLSSLAESLGDEALAAVAALPKMAVDATRAAAMVIVAMRFMR
jgi:hypothetical protein